MLSTQLFKVYDDYYDILTYELYNSFIAPLTVMHSCIMQYSCLSFHLFSCVFLLTGFIDESLVEGLLKECVKMQKFDHPNVLNLTGVCLDGGPTPFLVMPFMANGSLHCYLKKERKNLVILPELDSNEMV